MMREPTTQSSLESIRLSPSLRMVDVQINGYFPVRFEHDVKATRIGVFPAGCFLTDYPATFVAHGNVMWMPGDSESEIKLIGVDGLAQGTKYTMRLVVIGSE
jgi:hypothetical protein